MICRSNRLNIEGWLALTVTSAITFIIANAFPVMSVGLQNFRNDATLWEATTSLVQGGWAPMAVPAMLMAIMAPLAQIVLLGWVLAFAWHGQRAPGFQHSMKLLVMLRRWNMLDVAFLGVMVAAIKLSSMAEVAIGPGMWAIGALLCLTALTANGDLLWLWDATERKPQTVDP
ncbi:paraquat-inducible protein A [Dyella sp. GSA-30]|nr:paraquat-inducible protein A [Dyella sp. GSA-30]